MADIDSGRDTSGFKLFGTTIPVQVRPVKEEKVAEEGHGTTQKRPEKIIPCPRCKSMETKFCYFNNYNVNQPRHFCKGCQRYWTAGGTLRNVPIGAGRRKTKPTYQAPIGFSEDFIFNGSMVNEFDLDGIVEQWSSANPEGSFRRVFPAKRRSIGSAGQLC